jgi:hypothetical protein
MIMTIVAATSSVAKIANVLRYLEIGGEWNYKGGGSNFTLVWLDNHVTDTLSDGTQLGIHGIAIKGEVIRDGISSPYYLGTGFSFNTVVSMIEEIPNDDYLGMVGAIAMHEAMIKSRKSRE